MLPPRPLLLSFAVTLLTTGKSHLPGTFSPWVNKITHYMEDYFIFITDPINNNDFSVLNHNSKRTPKKFAYTMVAVKLNFNK